MRGQGKGSGYAGRGGEGKASGRVWAGQWARGGRQDVREDSGKGDLGYKEGEFRGTGNDKAISISIDLSFPPTF